MKVPSWLDKGLVFTSIHFDGDVEVDLVNEEDNDLEVSITPHGGQRRMEHWDLQCTVWGFEQGDYAIKKNPLAMNKKVIIVGCGNLSSAVAQTLNRGIEIIKPVHKIENQLTAFKNIPRLATPFIDPQEPVFNYLKHEQTCIKNRKKRKAKKTK